MRDLYQSIDDLLAQANRLWVGCLSWNRPSAAKLQQQQAEILAELGLHLKQVRQCRNITLDHISAQTHIRVKLLQAIEAGQAQDLPEPVFVRSYLKLYANALGIDGETIAQQYPVENRPTNRAQPKSLGSMVAMLRPVHLYLFYLSILVVAISSLARLVDGTQPLIISDIESSQAPGTAASGSDDQPLQNSTPQSVPSQDERVPKSPLLPTEQGRLASVFSLLEGNLNLETDNPPVQIKVTLREESWLMVISDGKTTFEGVLEEGTRRTWGAKEQLTLRAGNAGAVFLAVNNGREQRLGEPGSVEEVTIEANPTSAFQSQNLAGALSSAPQSDPYLHD